jgi:5-methylcytosine-specific restriction endonuclease McrA
VDPIIATIQTQPHQLKQFNNNELVLHLHGAVRGEHGFTVQVLLDLNEMYDRRLHLDLGYSSLFDYCTRCLEYSRSAAGRRIQAARCIRHFPETLQMLLKRELSLSTISFVEPILTDENKHSILERVRGASCRAVEQLVAEFLPPIQFRDRVQAVAVVMPVDKSTPGAGSVMKVMRLIRLLADEEQMRLFIDVHDLLSAHASSLSFADAMTIVYTEYYERHSPVARHARRQSKKGAASLDSRRRECDETHTRHIPDEVRDEIFVRDHGKCAYAGPDGTHCESTRGVQVDHIRPFAAGGNHNPSNLRLLCAAHNRRVAEKVFGSTHYRRE